MSEGQDSFNRFINDNNFSEFREGVAQIEDDHKPDFNNRPPENNNKNDYNNQQRMQNEQRPPRKRTRFDEPLIIPMDMNTNPTTIPSLLNLAVEAPPDIEIDLSDLRSDDEADVGPQPPQNGDDEEENWDHY